ncbi:bifunctional [glutamate--ammonia ligase]-adenylyl-L-tyrosine phosphorylase/[glutamate--ammonia-ligase] adenylyltransferase [Alteromonas stellipolaris]|uniref:bifunctional [glutamate--ammonia ligase]-adenylyl-L-tyrosine phosphorylase/[glutamate--ammonia-ligase] adenylyltransferase n=1 Tax=Alteromonas stellipolaris TaxID=233316 RepID=UPI002735778A|nr:bifunctional [glutamate--ammonia ligase]-adenylyl-L-tyrosine phosphorylase/[glutamate--ammonia-ligase] adenylyltransferase [Alteromonas stellipolaris]MDP2534482.1 bifunctional [glutamate--ammonia ligase]-adenylyl-L-tyrosine phosphorylase/[glutamate--ammonia-ligase] adenylyltransferase [Alteromonas stellipolaris]
MPTDNTITMSNAQQANETWEKLSDNERFNSDLAHHRNELTTLFGRSLFFAETCLQHPEWVGAMLIESIPDEPHTFYNYAVAQKLENVKSEDELLIVLRQCRHFYMAAITYRDGLNKQTITQSLVQVSALADVLITSAYQWLYTMLSDKHGVPCGEDGPIHMYIMGMGKLGGRELNFSSDIDLIFAYSEKGMTNGEKKPIENQKFFTRLAQKLIQALNKITTDGQVYRVDMRLRPFGESGPLVMHFDAMEDYYQEQGRHWERFAMVKARVINDDNSENVAALNAILTPFTFRRYLDFTTIDALRSMKHLIATEIRRRRLSNNIKLGAGGIREVEFFAQSFQLIHGGREPELQSKSLLTTLDKLAEFEIVETDVTEQLRTDYLFLRKTEHTLQQCQDRQTQTLPDSEWEKNALIAVLGFSSYDEFMAKLQNTMSRIHGHFNELVEEAQDTHTSEDTLFDACRDAWQLSLDKEEFSTTLTPFISVEEAQGICTQLQEFKTNQRGYRMGQKGEDTLNKLIPEILCVLIKFDPSKANNVLKRIFGVIDAITGRTTYLDLLLENPNVLQQLVKLCDRSEWIANEIKRFPLLLDELLTPLYLQQQNSDITTSKYEYAQELRQTMLRVEHDDVELAMDTWRQFKLCQQLRIAASDISGSLPIANVSDKLTVLAEVLLEHVIEAAWHQVSARFGVPRHLNDGELGFAVIGYGKLGGYELGYGSDLDLVFLHNAPRQSTTDGAKSIEAQQFYIKLAQRIMHLLNTKTLFGQLYETDLRLRPSGNAGLLCCHIDGFERYQQEEAWTWEHQALVRARGICGDISLLSAFNTVRHNILSIHRDQPTLSTEVSEMRAKMRKHLLSASNQKVDLKQCVGGIADIEFMTQYWVLAHANKIESLTEFSDNLRLLDATHNAGIIDEKQSHALQQAYLALREQYHHLTLADTKYAEQTEHLSQMRETVSEYWRALFGSGADTDGSNDNNNKGEQ